MKLRKRYNKSVVSQPSWFIFLSCILCVAIIGYAILSRKITVNGTANVPKTSWDVHFANVRVFGGSVAASVPTISNKTSINLNGIRLNHPNEYYKFLVDVENTGTLDAKITSMNLPTSTDKLDVKVTYKDGTALSINDILKAGKKRTLLVVLKYKNVTSAEEITADLTITVDYGQADNEAKEPTVEYTVDDFINITNGASTESYASNSIQSEMYAFAHDETDRLKANVDYRYIGGGEALTTKPDNYIKFNNEMWRIIGVFKTNDGKNRLKIIKDERISNVAMPWDYKGNGVGSSTAEHGSNNWTDAQLMYFLNQDDIRINASAKGYTFDGSLVKDTNGTVLYEVGKRPTTIANGATTYTGTTDRWRVSTDALTKVDSVTYYLSGVEWANLTYGTGEEIYSWERLIKETSGRPQSWSGKVALMYPSDYVYTFAKGIDDTCFANGYNCTSSRGGVPSNSWLYNSSISQWMLAFISSSTVTVFNVNSNGYVNHNTASSTRSVRPVVYLKHDITLGGSGTKSDPYVITN